MIKIKKIENEYVFTDVDDVEIARTDKLLFRCDMISVSRELGNPAFPVDTSVIIYKNDGTVGVNIELDDFRRQLANELGYVYTTFTKTQMQNKLRIAFEKVIEKAKGETAKIAYKVPPGV